MMEYLIRFLAGGVVVSAFAVLGDLFSPKSFAGLFAAAPSVALATLSLALSNDGSVYAAQEARSMLVGAIALFAYSWVTCRLLVRRDFSSLAAASAALPAWFAVAFALWVLFLK
ncbi:MAG: DUF3147 family protein [Betaproteobacteria bacterium]|nr:DUF3147 family protein [Betaproteobacteria bacterium]